MMKLGFVTAILPDLSFHEVLDFAAEEGYACIEVMCWPVGKADRRYAGVTHIDVTSLTRTQAQALRAQLDEYGVEISALGYYPNILCADRQEGKTYVQHLKKVIKAASLLEVNTVTSFIGANPALNVDDNFKLFQKVWPPIIRYAESQGVRIAIENCPMYFTNDEWPSGKNLAHSPAIWRRMFEAIPSDHFGLNYDPSHMIWQHMDPYKPIREFSDRIFHVHAKDVRLDQHRLDDVGIMATPNDYHCPKLPGLGDVDWGRFFSHLSDSGYQGPVCVEVEDRAYEDTLEKRFASLIQSYTYLQQFMPVL